MVSTQGLRGRVHGAWTGIEFLFLGYCRSMRAIPIHPSNEPSASTALSACRQSGGALLRGIGSRECQERQERSLSAHDPCPSKQAFSSSPRSRRPGEPGSCSGVEGVLLIIIPSNRLFRHSSGVLLFFSSWSNETSTRKQSRGVAKLVTLKHVAFLFPPSSSS